MDRQKEENHRYNVGSDDVLVEHSQNLAFCNEGLSKLFLSTSLCMYQDNFS
jgi:hypothetical protein